MSISTYKVTKKSAHIQVVSLDMCRLNYGLSLYRDFFSALATARGAFFMPSRRVSICCFRSAVLPLAICNHPKKPACLGWLPLSDGLRDTPPSGIAMP